MEILKTIKDSDLGLEITSTSITKERRASRAVVFDKDNKIALLDVVKSKYHKLPGGGIENGEDFIQALKRECKEEIGCEIEVTHELCVIEEFRYQSGVHQLSYCFIAKVVGEKGLPQLEASEEADGFETVWVNLEDAISILAAETEVIKYTGKFIQQRDLFILQEAQRILH